MWGCVRLLLDNRQKKMFLFRLVMIVLPVLALEETHEKTELHARDLILIAGPSNQPTPVVKPSTNVVIPVNDVMMKNMAPAGPEAVDEFLDEKYETNTISLQLDRENRQRIANHKRLESNALN
ncbi:hypothetical protein Btru_076214 [Bulinus truncatus]|nr:hypothetical protein Btru_076214 [Bulinus truncatus]